ncbi:MAG: RNA polymerase sigma-70 factor [Pseudolysinimonas sp.]|uniref:RNA polymerase sigma-70 factor n=1 Tax=Pseudolysinimonas sp. TaxID=2680009 RepID=UPI0032665072
MDVFDEVRPRLFGIAYRMLGSVHDTEDVLQDTWLRWQGADRDAVAEPGAYLATIVTRLSITALTSARARREVYVGPWLPEPVDTSADPLLGAELAEALSIAILVLLERLLPAERAAFVLYEAFDYPHARIAEVLEVSVANARQLLSRARKHLASERSRAVPTTERDRLLGAFLTAAGSGNLKSLESVLAADIVALSDGGGKVTAARKPIRGPQRVAQFVLGVLEKFGGGIHPVSVEVNGGPGMLGVRDGVPIAIWTIEAEPGGIHRIFMVVNPDKLSRFESLAALS